MLTIIKQIYVDSKESYFECVTDDLTNINTNMFAFGSKAFVLSGSTVTEHWWNKTTWVDVTASV